MLLLVLGCLSARASNNGLVVDGGGSGILPSFFSLPPLGGRLTLGWAEIVGKLSAGRNFFDWCLQLLLL